MLALEYCPDKGYRQLRMAKTMKDIAKQLGLSRTTVSLVMQGRGDEYRISQTTQNLIRTLVEETDFKPNYFAKALNSGKSAVIGAIFPDVFEPFMSNLIRGIETVLYHKGFSLTISTSRFDACREQALVEKTVWQGADGIILVPTMPFNGQAPYDSSHIRPLLDLGYPLAVVDRTIPDLETHRVLQDDYGMARSAIERLINRLGHPGTQKAEAEAGVRAEAEAEAGAEAGAKSRPSRPSRLFNIPCVSFDLAASSIKARVQAYIDAMQAAGLSAETLFLDCIDPESSDLADKVQEQLDSSRPPDAFFVTTAGLAEKLYWLLLHSRRLPTVPILRFGSSSQWLDSPFIEIAQPHEQMGVAVANLVLDLIERKAGMTKASGHRETRAGKTPEGKVEIRC
jgi:DNA-binding LacI/PurR family transcriptional regulator